MIVFQVSLNFDPVKEILKIRSTIFQPFQFETEEEKTCGKKLNTLMLQLSVYYILEVGNLNRCKKGHCKNEAREIDRLCCREVDAMFIASAKIQECKGSISSSSFYGDLPDYYSH